MACFNGGGITRMKFVSNTLLTMRWRMGGTTVTGTPPLLYRKNTFSSVRKSGLNFVPPLLERRIMNKFLLTSTSCLSASPHPLPLGQQGSLSCRSLRIPVPAANQVAYFHTSQFPLLQNRGNANAIVLPNLMDFPLIMWPSFIPTVRNWFFYHFVIRAYMDSEFNMGEFDRGARQAVSIVSKKLVSGKFDELEGLVDPATLAEVKQKMSTFSVFQRELLNVEIEDIFFSFPYQIGVIIPEQTESLQKKIPRSTENESDDDFVRPPQQRYVEITVVFHILRGFAEKSKRSEMPTLREFVRTEERNNVMVCNYRFFKDFTQGVENPTWIINMINHFLPADHVNKTN